MKTPRDLMARLLELATEKAHGEPRGIKDCMGYFDRLLARCMNGMLARPLTDGQQPMTPEQVMYSAARYAFELTCARYKLDHAPKATSSSVRAA